MSWFSISVSSPIIYSKKQVETYLCNGDINEPKTKQIPRNGELQGKNKVTLIKSDVSRRYTTLNHIILIESFNHFIFVELNGCVNGIYFK